MKTHPLVSVIVPVYKAEQYLDRCVTSIVCQTYSYLEIILVNDGSPDRCPQICNKLSKEDTRIKVIHKKNEGVTKARIDGFNASEGEYVLFIDADDTLHVNAIEELLNCSQEYNADISVCQVNIVYDNKSVLQFRNIKNGYYSKDDIVHLLGTNFLFDTKTHSSGFPLYLWGKLFKRKLLIDKLEMGIGFWYGEDMISIFPIMKEIKNMYISEKPLYNYFQNPLQVTQRPFMNLFPQYVKVWKYFEYTDIEGYLKKQLPQRMWGFIMSGLKTTIKSHSGFYAFRDLFYIIRSTPIVQQRIIETNLIKPLAPTYRLLHFLFRKKLTWLYYIIVKYDLFQKLKNIILINK